jgi:hypothetical protein
MEGLQSQREAEQAVTPPRSFTGRKLAAGGRMKCSVGMSNSSQEWIRKKRLETLSHRRPSIRMHKDRKLEYLQIQQLENQGRETQEPLKW